jgi:hypothetical protein
MTDPYRTAEREREELQAWFYWLPHRWRRWQVVSFLLLILVVGVLHGADASCRSRADAVRAEVQAAEYAAKHPDPPQPCADALYNLNWHASVVCGPKQKLTVTGGYATCSCKVDGEGHE